MNGVKAESKLIIGLIPATTRVQGDEEADDGRQIRKRPRAAEREARGFSATCGNTEDANSLPMKIEIREKRSQNVDLESVKGPPIYPQTYQCKQPSYDT